MAEMRPYIVRQGDYVAKLAFVNGFDADEVWSHPKNKDLREHRKTPWVLCEGDVLYIPAGDGERSGVTLESANAFGAKVPTVKVDLRLVQDGEPIADQKCLIETLEGPKDGQTDGDGRLSVEVPVLQRDLRVFLTERGVLFELAVGELDPADVSTGKKQRLQNLGYIDETWERLLASEGADAERDTSALETATGVYLARHTGAEAGEVPELLVKEHGV